MGNEDEATKSSNSDTTVNNSNNNTSNRKLKKSRSTSFIDINSGQGIDAHPYARGSVIEVRYGSSSMRQTHPHASANNDHPSQDDDNEDSNDDDDFDFDEDFDDDDDYNDDGNKDTASEIQNQSEAKDENGKNNLEDDDKPLNDNQNLLESNIQHPSTLTPSSIILADIIDRAPSKTPDHIQPALRWRYYIHYREYNRRMDEWIDSTRIVSPPSVGNAKVRAMKKAKAARDEEERRRVEREKREREEKALLEESFKRSRKSLLLESSSLDGELDGTGDNNEEGDALANTSPMTSSSRPTSQRVSSRRASAAITSAVQGMSTITQSTTSDSNANIESNFNSSMSNIQLAAVLEESNKRNSRRKTRGVSSSSLNNLTDDSIGNLTDGNLFKLSNSVVNLLLPDDEQDIKDKVITVAAQELDEHEGLDEMALREHEEVTKVKNVKKVQLGKFRMDTWYYSPLPKELVKDTIVEVLYVCEFTLNFFTRKEELLRFHTKELPKNRRHPPGNEIYRNGNLSMFEVDGYEERIYCQNLCYIAKLYLDHKTLYFDVDPFLFYVLCEVDNRGFHPVGYYSKEKYSDVGYNLACILTFPCHQRKGYGRFLIDFSYELSKKEEKVGSPEKPISDLGQQAYKPYWTSKIIDFLLNHNTNESSISIMEISKCTSIMAEDIIYTLNLLGLLKYINGVYFLTAERGRLEELSKKHPIKEPRVDPSKLHWTPYLTDVKRDKFSIHSKKLSVEDGDVGIGSRGSSITGGVTVDLVD